jgi:hypothetical protein
MDSLEYNWRIDGVETGWLDTPYYSIDTSEIRSIKVFLYVRDRHGDESRDHATIEVLNVLPTAELPESMTVNEDEEVELMGMGTDTPSHIDDLMYKWEIADPHETEWSSDNDTTYTFTEPVDHTITFWIKDPAGGMVSAIMIMTVLNVNDDPIIGTADVVTATEDEPYQVSYEAVDIDPTSDVFEWSLLSDAGFLSIDAGTGMLSGTPSDDDVGEWWVNISVGDGKGGSDWTNFTLTVTNVNDAPEVLGSISINGSVYKEGKKIVFTVDTLDVDGDTLTITWKEGETVLGTGSPFEYSKLSKGKHTITVVVDDGTEAVEETFTVTVKEADENPGFGLVAVVIALIIAVMIGIKSRKL